MEVDRFYESPAANHFQYGFPVVKPVAIPFPEALRKLMDDEKVASEFGVSWSKDGEAVEFRPDFSFEDKVVKGWFHMKNMPDFFASVALYRFSVTSVSPLVIKHPLFQREKPYLVHLVVHDVAEFDNFLNESEEKTLVFEPELASSENQNHVKIDEISTQEFEAIELQIKNLAVTQLHDSQRIERLEKENKKLEEELESARRNAEVISGLHNNLSTMSNFFTGMLTEQDRLMVLTYRATLNNTTESVQSLDYLLNAYQSSLENFSSNHNENSLPSVMPARSPTFESVTTGTPLVNDFSHFSSDSSAVNSVDRFSPLIGNFRSRTPPLADIDDNHSDFLFHKIAERQGSETEFNFNTMKTTTDVGMPGGVCSATGECFLRDCISPESNLKPSDTMVTYAIDKSGALRIVSSSDISAANGDPRLTLVYSSNGSTTDAKVRICSTHKVGGKDIELGYNCVLSMSKFFNLPKHQQEMLNIPEVKAIPHNLARLDPAFENIPMDRISLVSKNLFGTIKETLAILE